MSLSSIVVSLYTVLAIKLGPTVGLKAFTDVECKKV